jgi:hypothetical protein
MKNKLREKLRRVDVAISDIKKEKIYKYAIKISYDELIHVRR